MGLSQYSKGASVERQLVKWLSGKGYGCLRSAGSKGAYDVVAWDKNIVRFIQVKHHASLRNVSRLDLDKTFLGVVPAQCTKELWVYTRGQKWTDIYVDGIRAGIKYPEGATIHAVDGRLKV